MKEGRFQKKLSYLKKINRIKTEKGVLSNLTFLDGYNFWITFQNRLFHFEIDNFFQNKKEIPQSLIINFKSFLINTILLMSSLLAIFLLIIRKSKILVYAVDKDSSKLYKNDRRMDSSYKYLLDNKVSFGEIFHTLIIRESVFRLLRRFRPVIYIESIDFLYKILVFLRLQNKFYSQPKEFDLSEFSENEKGIALSIVKKQLSLVDRSIFRIKFLTKIFSHTSFEVLLAIDDARDYFELIRACRNNSIKTYAFQHGHFSKYHVGWLNDGTFGGEIIRPDKLFVWSKYWKDELLSLNTYFKKDEIVVGGNKFSTDKPREIKEKQEYNILIPYETAAEKEEVLGYINKLLSCDSFKIIFKLRSDVPEVRQLSEYGLSKNYHKNFRVVLDTKGLDIDLVLGTYSTFLYDSILSGIRVAVLNTDNDYGEGLIKNKLAVKINAEDDICEKIKFAIQKPVSEVEENQKLLSGDKSITLEETLEELLQKYKR